MDDDLLLDLAAGTDGVIYAALQIGLMRSADGGSTWQVGFLAEGVPATAVACGESAVYAAVPGGIGRSDDRGQTWRFVTLPEPAPLVACLAVAEETVIAGTMRDGAFISDDRGRSWRASNAGLFDADVRGVAVSPSSTSDRTLFAATSTGLFRSGNAGRRWRPFGDLPKHEPLAALRRLPDGALFAAVEGAGLWRSTDAGAHWACLAAPELPIDIELLVATPAGALILSGDGVALRSTDAGETWRPIPGLVAGLLARTATETK